MAGRGLIPSNPHSDDRRAYILYLQRLSNLDTILDRGLQISLIQNLLLIMFIEILTT